MRHCAGWCLNMNNSSGAARRGRRLSARAAAPLVADASKKGQEAKIGNRLAGLAAAQRGGRAHGVRTSPFADDVYAFCDIACRPILLKGHDGPLTCVKYNKDGDLLFTTCRRGRINLWYSDDGERIGTYNSGAKPGAVMYVDVNCEFHARGSAGERELSAEGAGDGNVGGGAREEESRNISQRLISLSTGI